MDCDNDYYTNALYSRAYSEALDIVYGPKVRWDNPFHALGVSISSHKQSPYEAYLDLKPEYQKVVQRLIGRIPTKEEE